MNSALQIIIQLLNLSIAAGAAVEQYAAIRARVEAMVAEDRDPTDEEWADLLSDVQRLSARLEAADQRLGG